ncbi:hypothetical protein BR93DRAFT_362637 [Coniochaeta sp. PMI_546]|nr:hypothetical protein BR93DRAFT_362637 [Coniochaeta sp. PMI_546]
MDKTHPPGALNVCLAITGAVTAMRLANSRLFFSHQRGSQIMSVPPPLRFVFVLDSNASHSRSSRLHVCRPR